MTGSNESAQLHTLTRSSEAGCVFRNDTFMPAPDFSSAASRLNILCRAGVSNRKTKRMLRTHEGAAVGSKHALAESFRPILSAVERFDIRFWQASGKTNLHTPVSASGAAPSIK